MGLVERAKTFVTKQRDWRWLVAAALLALAGSWFNDRPIDQLTSVTRTVSVSLNAVQPFEIAGIYISKAVPMSGLGVCPPFGERSPHGSLCDVGVVAIIRLAIAHVIATPAVAIAIWQTTGWPGRIIFSITVALIAAFLWRRSRAERAGENKDFFAETLMALVLGPVAIGAVFWTLLQVLIFLVWVFGMALVGAGICAVTFGGVYKIAMVILGIVKSADDLKEKAEMVGEDVKRLRGD